MSDFKLPSRYQFLAMDIAYTIDYSKEAEVNDNVLKLFAPLPSPLYKNKQALECHQDTSMSGDDDDAR